MMNSKAIAARYKTLKIAALQSFRDDDPAGLGKITDDASLANLIDPEELQYRIHTMSVVDHGGEADERKCN